MREADQTTRERMADRLREDALPASALAKEFDVQTTEALDHVRHVARSLAPTAEELLVAPPTCRDCGFDRFDDPANRPSRCPECRSQALTEPEFRIE
ncbi:MAG: putative transcriptional regulator containing an HTH domain fused to a Zn-ribbon [halophilic archaeon J07HX64]|jgi:Predicted transcriptional regulator containing an HTH domain fused to a Zn-ribbon|nr:MAG: putative transcriptional regulator containing an HTH domain fused to a Zn-ribbon [halophilic archaeon J07HX64]